jgi:hypothetical protein
MMLAKDVEAMDMQDQAHIVQWQTEIRSVQKRGII